MAKLIRFEKEMTLEEYVIAEVCANYGTQTRVTVPVLKHILDVCEITYKKNATKEEMIRQLYEYFAAFPFVTNADIKRLEKFEVLKVVGYQEFRAYGKYKYAALYDLEQFMNMTAEQMQEYLKEYPKGKRKTTRKGEKE